MSRSREELARQWVERFQVPIYNYVRRMVRNESDAADLTQEVFAAVFASRALLDAERDPGPYFYRTATHQVYRWLRSNSRRTEREQRFAMSRRDETKGAEMTDPGLREEQELIEQVLHELPEEQRSLLVLHYYNGLSASEIARTLDSPRSTIRDRLAQALESLRSSLRSSGHLAVMGNVEVLMRGTPASAVPASLTHTLQLLASTSAGVATAAGISVGGLIVTKNIIAASCAVLVVASLAGYGVGALQFSTAEDADAANPEVSQELAQSREQQQELEQLLAQRDDEIAELKRKADDAVAEKVRLQKAVAKLQESQGATATVETTEATSGVDWQQLAQLFASRAPLLMKMAQAKSPEELSPSEQRQAMEVEMALTRAAALAREQSAYPILEAEVLPQLLQSTIGSLLGLDQSQLQALGDDARELLEQHSSEYPESPLEAYLQRQKIFEELQPRLSRTLDAAQRERWDALDGLWKDFTAGDRRKVDVGLRRDSGSDVVLKELKRHYRATDEQEQDFQRMADQYVESAKALLDRYGRMDTEPRTLEPAEQAALRLALRELQLRQERAIFELLSPEQRERLEGSTPMLMNFEVSGNISIDHSGSGGF